MNGGQDLGGTHGHGPVKPEPNEPVFHGEWEKRAFALTLAMGMPGGWNIDMSRFARENRPPAEYLSMTYYQIWFAALETMLKERDLVSEDEIAAGHSLHPAKPVKRTLSPGDVAKTLHRGGPTERDTNTKAAFKPGDKVARKTSTRPRTRACRATCAVTSARSSALSAATFSRTAMWWSRREPAVALHCPLRRTRTMG